MMEGYVVSLNGNILQVSLLGSDEVFEKKISDPSNPESFAEQLGELILESYGEEAQKLPLHFLIPPDGVVLSFITGNKKEKISQEERIEKDISKRLAAFALTPDDVYSSHQKIAPFVQQLVAVKKELVEFCTEVGRLMDFRVAAVVPWALLLPKFMPNPVDPKIFVLDAGDEKVLVLSELGGVYHVGSLNEKKVTELKKLVKELSVYERPHPISEIYLFGIEKFDMGDDYLVSQIGIEHINQVYTPALASDVAYSQVNALNLLPLEEVKEKSPVLTYVGIAAAAIIIILGFVFFRGMFNGTGEDASDVSESTPTQVTETTESTTSQQENQTQEQEDQPELDREYLRIRVENGAGVPGLAGRTQTFLSGLGYEIVSIGDADESDRTVTLVRITPQNSLYRELLTTDLREMYTDVQVQENLGIDLGYDVLIIAGSNEK